MAEVVHDNLPAIFDGEYISADDEYHYGWDCPPGFEDSEPLGRRRRFPTPHDLDMAVDHFVFTTEQNNLPRTLARMLWVLGISRTALDRYATYDKEFGASVARARLVVTMSYEDAVLLDKNGAAARILGAMDPHYNPAIKVEATTAMTHEDRLAHLR